jgi:hypothetical protein
LNKIYVNLAWWYKAIIPALWGLRQKEYKFKARLGYTVRACLKNKTKK